MPKESKVADMKQNSSSFSLKEKAPVSGGDTRTSYSLEKKSVSFGGNSPNSPFGYESAMMAGQSVSNGGPAEADPS